MAKSILFSIEPTILKYARKTSGYSLEDVAKKTKVSIEKLQLYEEKKIDISVTQIEKFANLYKRPMAFFLLLKIPEGIVLPKDFRMVYSEKDHPPFSPKFYLAIRRARYIQSILKDLSETKFEYKLPVVTVKDDVERLSEWFRDFIKIDFNKQKHWDNPSKAFRAWKDVLEEKNIYILQTNLSKDHVSALCLTDEKPYIILLNSNEHEFRRIFSLFHEIGHILLRKSGVCNLDDLSRNSYDYIQIEKFCNQFAASTLLPLKELKEDPSVINLLQTPFFNWNNDDIKHISQKFKVSKEAFLRRLLSVGAINEENYETWKKVWLKETEEYKKETKKDLRIPQYIKCLSQNGRAFTSFILSQFHTNRITYDSAADILNIAPKHITSLESRIW